MSKIVNYATAYEFLNSLYSYEADAKRISAPEFHLKNIEALLEKLGNPHKKYASFHIAGTKGKGSVAAMLTAIAIANNCNVGTYISPHLIDMRERITLNNVFIDDETFTITVQKISEFLQCDVKEYATFFEALTASAFAIFALKNIDVAVVEAGMGGKYDATNVIVPNVAVLTNIGLDHTERLGDTIAKIAYDKAHIAKPNVPLVLQETNPEAVAMVLAVARERGSAAVFRLGEDYNFRVLAQDVAFTVAEIVLPTGTIVAKIPLAGKFQARNAATAAMAASTFGYDLQCIAGGLEATRIRSRFEILTRTPLTIVDGAHNPDSAKAIAEEIADLHLAPATFVMGINKPKDFATMLMYLAPVARRFVFGNLESARSYSSQELANFAATALNIDTFACTTLKDALIRAQSLCSPTETIFVTGSLYALASLL